MARLIALLLAALGVGHPFAASNHTDVTQPQRPTFTAAGGAALATLLDAYYAGGGEWHACDSINCAIGDADWGYDSLTYSLALREQATGDRTLSPILDALAQSARTYPSACTTTAGCPYWSDTPEWDSIALTDEYLVTHDPIALSKAQLAFGYVAGSTVFASGACPAVPYQEPGGGRTELKTLETEANAVKAALLLYGVTKNPSYLAFAESGYQTARTYFLDRHAALYTVYVFDDGRRCAQLPHRFFASVNGDMIWSGVQLYADLGNPSYLAQALATAAAVQQHLSDGRGIFADLQAENDVAEPLVEGMYALAAGGQSIGRQWLLRNAAAALSARTAAGAFGRFFDGPPPASTVTAWQTNGGLALEIAAAALAPDQVASPAGRWRSASYVRHDISVLPAKLRVHGSAVAVLGTLGERAGGLGHARVLVDGHETFDQSGIWQNKSSSLLSIPGTVLFAWSWPRAGTHTLTFLPGLWNAKEGGSFLHVVGYDVLRH